MKEIYLELKEVVKFDKRRELKLSDIGKVYSEEKLKNEVDMIVVSLGKYESEVIKAIDVIKKIKIKFPQISISLIGPATCLVMFDSKKQNGFGKFIKVLIGSLISFFGSFVAIMTFQNDVSLASTLTVIYKAICGTKDGILAFSYIPYSVGIAIGIIMFYMKFKGHGISPVEVDIDKYEKDIKESEVKLLEKKGMRE